MIALDRDDGVWTVTLDRSDKANALTGAMLRELVTIVQSARKEQARALILTGRGRIFSAGADLDEARAGLATDPVWEQLSGGIAALPCLTIAALNGTLAGGAFGMAIACDLRVAATHASFFYPVMKLGFLPQPSDPARLTALIGPARAKMILMAGEKIGSDEALAWGLIDRAVPGETVLQTARMLAQDVGSASAEHVSAIKSMMTARTG